MDDPIEIQIDARGLRCPLPVIRAAKVLREAKAQTIVRVLADDPMAQIDLPNFCREAGYHLVSETKAADHQIFVIQKA